MTDPLGDLTWPKAERQAGASGVLVVPIGSTEQHGPHLPLSTDTDIAVALAERLVQEVEATTLAPAIPYGASGEHEAFPGTVSIGLGALELVLVELGRSASATFTGTVFVSAHGGNAEAVMRACSRLRQEGRHVLAWAPRHAGDAHAGRVETSIMLALDEQRVERHRTAAGNVEPLAVLWPRLRAHGVRAVSPNGILGDPRGASPAEGRRLLGAAAQSLVTAVQLWAGGESQT